MCRQRSPFFRCITEEHAAFVNFRQSTPLMPFLRADLSELLRQQGVWEVLFKKNFSNPAAKQVQPEECDNQSCPIKKEQEETASNAKGEQSNFGGSWSTLPSWPVGASHGRVSQSQRGKHRCSFCTYSSDLISDITKHERKHTGEKPYVCRICHKAFVCSDSLADHLRIHTGGRRFCCQPCQKASARS